jgi:hypothetical protein
VPKGANIATVNGKAHFNPILWLVNRGQDLPSWLALDSTRVAVLSLGLPDFETRLAAARHLGNLVRGFDAATAARGKLPRIFAQRTDGLPLSQWRTSRNSPTARASAFATSTMRCSASRSAPPKIRGRKTIARTDRRRPAAHRGTRVRPATGGHQDHRHPDAFDGLTGAQARATGNRPRGVLFFAGSTGVGKTELPRR